MKRTIILLTTLFLLVGLCTTLLTGCGGDPAVSKQPNSNHKHEYKIVDVQEVTCTKDGYTVYECYCGEFYQTDEVKATGHDWQPATCTNLETCSRCQETQGEYVAHNYVDEECTVCGKSEFSLGLELGRIEAGKLQGYLLYGRGECSDRYILIPHTYKGRPVVSIDSMAFYENYGLHGVQIPESVIEIGRNAFRDCSNLKEVTFVGNSKLEQIWQSAFQECKSLISIEIPESVTWIGEAAFAECTSLKQVLIPEGITMIAHHTFADCTSLVQITIPNSVLVIEESAFFNCTDLEQVIVGQGVTEIQKETFFNCNSLTHLTLGQGVTTIAEEAFAQCTKLTTIIYQGTVEQWNQINLASNWLGAGEVPAVEVICTNGTVSLK